MSKVLKGRLGVNEPSISIASSIVYEEGEDAAQELQANLSKLLKDLPSGTLSSHITIISHRHCSIAL